MWNLFGNKSKSNLPEPTALETQRAKQIELLKAFNQNVTELQRDLEYKVNTVVNGVSISLSITLPPRFPNDKPTVKVSPPVQHPWIGDQYMVIGCPDLNNFMMHSDLGKVINDIVEEFQRNPPKVIDAQTHTHAAPRYSPYPAVPYPPQPAATANGFYPSSVYNPTLSSSSQFVPTAQPPTLTSSVSAPIAGSTPYPAMFNDTLLHKLPRGPPGTYQLPEIPTRIESLEGKSHAELQELLANETKLISLLSEMPQVQQISRDRAAISDFNEKQAKDNLSMKPVLEEKKRLLLEKYDHLNDLRQRFDQNASRQDLWRKEYGTTALENKLKMAAHEAEEQAEHIAENFVAGSISVDEFKRDYLEKRKLSHLRRVKEEKLSTGRVVQAAFK